MSVNSPKEVIKAAVEVGKVKIGRKNRGCGVKTE